MFEKSLYDLIRGLRNHKGNEGEYIQSNLRECRAEIRSQDMDTKATALLKLVYLEMFGYDMSWAAFHVLEVMSSQSYIQKRVGYLGAVQSFRPDTEVLMLTTNLLKKDLVSPFAPIMSLPLITLPHIISPSLALSLLSDILPRLSHSNSSVRKKSIVNLYRLSLVYPEAFRVAWPKLKDCLMDEQEDSSVTAVVINVICELGWRRPEDFLPLAPRLFNLLVDGNNNWMAIKIIKLFASLTPLEPRLVRKLLRPLIVIIQSTSAMSLLYECINGVIQGGILEGSEGVREGEIIAHLCVEKLRGMLILGGDPNLKYVSLLAFNRIVLSHPELVSQQQDVLLDCLEDNDISIRIQALQLVSGMVTSSNLQAVVDRLITQLRTAPFLESSPAGSPEKLETVIEAEEDDQDIPAENARKPEPSVPLLADFRIEVINRIVEACSQNLYSAVCDFQWYVNVLLQLVKLIPPWQSGDRSLSKTNESVATNNPAARIGCELRNISVRVKTVRPIATRAAESLVLLEHRSVLFPSTAVAAMPVLESLAWVIGEFAEYLLVPEQTLESLIHPTSLTLPSMVISSYIQALPKIFLRLLVKYTTWNLTAQNQVSSILERVVKFLEQLSSHPDLNVQERAIGFLELFNIASEVVSGSKVGIDNIPLLFSDVIPSLFLGLDLNPVASDAQNKVPVPSPLDLDSPLNDRVLNVLNMSENTVPDCWPRDESHNYYATPVTLENKISLGGTSLGDRLPPVSYQNSPEDPSKTFESAKQRVQHKERNLDDPFYIRQNESSFKTITPGRQQSSSIDDKLDIDAIPIVDLALGNDSIGVSDMSRAAQRQENSIEIIEDETIDASNTSSDQIAVLSKTLKTGKALLEVDSSVLGHLPLVEDPSQQFDHNKFRDPELDEMSKAMARIEQVRLERQRVSERIYVNSDIPPEGDLVKRKKKRPGVVKKHKRAGTVENGDSAGIHGENPVKVKKKKKKNVQK